MIRIKQIIGGTSSKGLAEELHSEQSKMAIDRCNQRLQREGNLLGVRNLTIRLWISFEIGSVKVKEVVGGTRTTAIARLNLLIKVSVSTLLDYHVSESSNSN